MSMFSPRRITSSSYRSQLLLGVAALGLAGCLGAGADATGSSSQSVGGCPPSPAPALFDNALCLCGDFDEVGAALSTHAAGAKAASVGVNGLSNVVGFDQVDGSWAAYGGMNGTGAVKVRDTLSTTGDLRGVGHVDVGGDLSVGGDLEGVGLLTVGGTLRVGGVRATLGPSQVQATGAYSAPAGPPCACDGSSFLDVAKVVADAKAKNDNGAHGLPTSLAVIGKNDLTLPTGSYYFDHVETVGLAHFVIDGVVALHLDGSIDAVGAELIELKPGAQLDLYVAGSVRTVGALKLGDDPSAVRLYVGGTGASVLSVGLQELSGAIYAPTAQIAFVGDTTIHGALFGKNLAGVGLLSIDYTAPTAPGQSQCPPAPAPVPMTPGTPGTPPGGSTGTPPIN